MYLNVAENGLIGDGVTNHTQALNALSKQLSKTGGTLYFPAGRYVTGTLFLYSNMTLCLDAGAVLQGSDRFDDFPFIDPNEVKGYTRGGRWGLVSAWQAQNVRICGGGKTDGNGKLWWDSQKSDYERPRTINLIQCKDVVIEDITICNSPCWTIHPMCCENVSIRSVSIYNPYDSPNTDGINPESCKNVRISDCHIDVGDDCVTIKSGDEQDLLQKQYACENIIVTNCTMAHGHGGVVLGSEMSGGIKNVTVSNCIFQNTDRGIRIKTRRRRGGSIKGVTFSNIIMENVMACITVNEYYFCVCGDYPFPKEELFDPNPRPIDPSTPDISDIRISGILATGVKGVGIYFYGLPELPVRNVTISDVRLDVVGNDKGMSAVMAFDRTPSFGEGIFLENASNVDMSGVYVQCPWEKVVLKNADHITLNGEHLA